MGIGFWGKPTLTYCIVRFPARIDNFAIDCENSFGGEPPVVHATSRRRRWVLMASE